MVSNDSKKIILTGAQVRAARALVRLTAKELANAASVGLATVKRVEADDGPLKTIPATGAALRRALENAGIEFIEPNGGGEGVRRAAIAS